MAPLIERIPWSLTAARALRVALNGYDAEFQREVERGVARLWCINGGEAYLITRLESAAGHPPELVVCAFAGRGLRAIAPAIIAAARAHGCATIRFHATRPAIGRMTRALGARLREYVYEIELREVGHG